jgi:hypothetical protein
MRPISQADRKTGPDFRDTRSVDEREGCGQDDVLGVLRALRAGQSVSSAEKEMREGTHTVHEPEDLVALLPAPDRRAQNLSPPRRHRPRLAPIRRARRSPRTRRRGSRSRSSALRAISASALRHPARRARTRTNAIAPYDVHPVQAESASTWPGPGAGRGASLRKSAPASPLPSRTRTSDETHRLSGGGHDNG